MYKQGKSLFCDFNFFFSLGIKITINPESKAVLAGQFVKLCCRATGHPFVQYQWFKMNKEVIFKNISFNSSVIRRENDRELINIIVLNVVLTVW